jgi:chromosomal replication initiator protein
MNSAAVDQIFSVPFRHLWGTHFSGEQSASEARPSGLARFVGDEPNRLLRYLALEAGQRIPSNPFGSGFQWPLVLFGPSGTGKTSLALTLVSDQIDELEKSLLDDSDNANKALFMTALDFDRRYRSALETDSIFDFRRRLIRCVGLVVDDVHRLVDKPAAQNEFVLVLDERCRKNRPSVVTTDHSPQLSTGLSSQLVSRLSGGLCLPVHPPGAAARMEIIRDLAQIHNVNLTGDATQLLADRMIVTAPKLSHFLAQIKTKLHSIDDDPTLPVDAAKLTRLFRKSDSDLDLFSRLIIHQVSKVFHLKQAELKSNSRKQSIVMARGVAIYLNRILLGTSFLKIGSYFGNRDHSTIMHSFRKIEKLVTSSDANSDAASTKSVVESLKQQLSEQFASQINFV